MRRLVSDFHQPQSHRLGEVSTKLGAFRPAEEIVQSLGVTAQIEELAVLGAAVHGEARELLSVLVLPDPLHLGREPDDVASRISRRAREDDVGDSLEVLSGHGPNGTVKKLSRTLSGASSPSQWWFWGGGSSSS